MVELAIGRERVWSNLYLVLFEYLLHLEAMAQEVHCKCEVINFFISAPE